MLNHAFLLGPCGLLQTTTSQPVFCLSTCCDTVTHVIHSAEPQFVLKAPAHPPSAPRRMLLLISGKPQGGIEDSSLLLPVVSDWLRPLGALAALSLEIGSWKFGFWSPVCAKASIVSPARTRKMSGVYCEMRKSRSV